MDQRDDVPGKVLAFTAVFEPDPETGCMVVTFPAIPSLATQDDNLEHARQMAVECLGAYLEHLQAHGLSRQDSCR